MKPGRATLVLVLALPALAQPPAGPRPLRSGFEDMGASTQALQRDDTLNPGMLWVMEGEALAGRKPVSAGAATRACLDCHSAASLRGVAARHPAFDATLGRPVNLAQRINQCRQRHQGLPALASEAPELLALTAWVGHQSRGLPISPPDDPRLRPHLANGQALWQQRLGQLNLSCAQCHDQRAGARLGSAVIPQGHPDGYPIYRLEWQTLGSLSRRVRGCLNAVRAEPWAAFSPELTDLEVYLAARAAGLPVQTPGVRP